MTSFIRYHRHRHRQALVGALYPLILLLDLLQSLFNRHWYSPLSCPGFSVLPLPLRFQAPTTPLPYSSAFIVAMPSPVLLKTWTKPPLGVELRSTSSLIARGSLTLWLDEAVLSGWYHAGPMQCGAQWLSSAVVGRNGNGSI
jgi:hypothetical protein